MGTKPSKSLSPRERAGIPPADPRLRKARDKRLQSNHQACKKSLLLPSSTQLDPATLAHKLGAAGVQSIKYDDIVFGNSALLGQGATARVRKGTWKQTPVAVKEFAGIISEVDFYNEVLVTSSLRHPNVVPFVGFCVEPMLCIVTQYYRKGALYDILHPSDSFSSSMTATGTTASTSSSASSHDTTTTASISANSSLSPSSSSSSLLTGGRDDESTPPVQEECPLSQTLTLKFAIDIARAMYYLHDRGIIHRDLKSANVLVNSVDCSQEVTCLVADFGISRESAPNMTMGTGTPAYIAPESFYGAGGKDKDSIYTNQVDVFSFGVMLWEMFSRKVPYDGLGVFDIFDMVKEGRRLALPPVSPDFVPLPAVSTLISECWAQDPAERPPFEEITTRLMAMLEQEKAAVLAAPSVAAPPSAAMAESSLKDDHHPGGSGSGSGSGGSGFFPGTTATLAENAVCPVTGVVVPDVCPGDLLFSTTDVMRWGEFVDRMCVHYGVFPDEVEPIRRFIVTTSGSEKDDGDAGGATAAAPVVTKKAFVHFMKWFCPFVSNAATSLYQTNDGDGAEEEDELAFTIASITELIDHPWFHGFISITESKTRLARQKAGTFLIRFSGSSPGYYALDLKQVDGKGRPQVLHWRVVPVAGTKKFSIFQTEFASLLDIFEAHREKPMALGASNKASRSTIGLMYPCPRPDA